MVHGSGSVWVNGKDDAEEVSISRGGGEVFYVTPTPLNFTPDTSQLNKIASGMGKTGCSNANIWCDGADFYRDGEVDLLDVARFFYEAGDAIDVIADMYEYQDMVVPGEPNGPEHLIVLGPEVAQFEISKDSLIFAADDLESGQELWQVDLKTSEPNLLDLNPGLQGSYPHMLTRVGEDLYYVAVSGEIEDTYHSGNYLYCWNLYKLPVNSQHPISIKEDIFFTYRQDNTPPDPGNKAVLIPFEKGLFFFVYSDPWNIDSLWKTDSQTNELTLIDDDLADDGVCTGTMNRLMSFEVICSEQYE